MAYGFNDDKSKNDLSDVVRTADVADVLQRKYYDNQITVGNNNFEIEFSHIVKQFNMAYMYFSLHQKTDISAGWHTIPISFPNDVSPIKIPGNYKFPPYAIFIEKGSASGGVFTITDGFMQYSSTNQRYELAILLGRTWQATEAPVAVSALVMLDE